MPSKEMDAKDDASAIGQTMMKASKIRDGFQLFIVPCRSMMGAFGQPVLKGFLLSRRIAHGRIGKLVTHLFMRQYASAPRTRSSDQEERGFRPTLHDLRVCPPCTLTARETIYFFSLDL